MFAIGRAHDDEAAVTFKVSEVAFEMLQGEPGLRPAPYLALMRLEMDSAFRKVGRVGRRA